MSLSSTYLSRKKLIADNLQSMGVLTADETDGLTTLANKILDIEPSISGLDLDTSLVLHSSDDTCLIGQSIMFWAECKADYDDETATDVDLSGVLTGATVEFKNGNTVLGTAVTDSDGIAYYTHTFATAGVYDISASFNGTDNFDDCVSNSISVSVTYRLVITADKPILSYNDHEYATISATLSDGSSGVSGETLSYEILDKEDNVLDSGSDVTDSLGEISFTYQSAGVGNVQVIVYYGMFLQETFVVQDLYLYDPASSSSGLTHYGTPIPLQSSNTNCQIEYDSTMNAYKVTDKSSSIKGIPFDLSNLPSSISIEADLYVRSGTANSVIGIFGGSASNGFDYLLTNFENWLFAKNIFTGTTQSVKLSNTSKTAQWVHLTVTNNNGSVTATFSQNDTTIVTDTISVSNISQYGIATGWGNGYYAYIKNIKVKAL